MKNIIPKISAVILSAFGLLTLFLSSAVIFDLFNVRESQGNYVLFIVWTNLISSLIYLISAYGFVHAKKWTFPLLVSAIVILLSAFIALKIYVSDGGIHEAKTISAMIFRLSVTTVFAGLAYFFTFRKSDA